MGKDKASTYTTERVDKAVSSIDRLKEAMKGLTSSRQDTRGALKDYKGELREIATAGKEAKKGTEAAGSGLDKLSKQKSALKELGSSIKDLGVGVAYTSGLISKVSLGDAISQFKSLRDTTVTLDRSGREAGGTFQKFFDGLEQKTGQSSAAMANLASQLESVIFNTKFAAEGSKEAGMMATAFGGTAEQYAPLITALSDAGVKSEELAGELDRTIALAKDLGTIGGPRALAVSLGSIRGQLLNLAAGKKNFDETAAIHAVNSKTMSPERAAAATSGIVDQLKANARNLEYNHKGLSIMNDQGQVDNPMAAGLRLEKDLWKEYGGNQKKMARVVKDWGALGPAILNKTFSKAAAAASRVDQTDNQGLLESNVNATQEKLGPEAQRQLNELQRNKLERDMAQPVAETVDKIHNKLGPAGSLGVDIAAGALGSQVLGRGVKYLKTLRNVSAAGGAAAGAAETGGGTLASGAAAGLALPVAAGAATLALGAGINYAGGVQQDLELRQEFRESQAQQLGMTSAKELDRMSTRTGGGPDQQPYQRLVTLDGSSADALATAIAAKLGATTLRVENKVPPKVQPAS